MGHNLFYCFLRGKIALCWDTNVLISQLPGRTSPAHIPFNLLRNGVSYSSDLEYLCFLELSMMMIVEICWMGSNQHLAFSQPKICIWDGNLKETSLTWDSEWKENPSKDPRILGFNQMFQRRMVQLVTLTFPLFGYICELSNQCQEISPIKPLDGCWIGLVWGGERNLSPFPPIN